MREQITPEERKLAQISAHKLSRKPVVTETGSSAIGGGLLLPFAWTWQRGRDHVRSLHLVQAKFVEPDMF